MDLIRRFFYGRNGRDPLNIALLVLGFVFNVLSRFLFANVFTTLFYAAILLCIFRALSRDLPRRQAENALFLEKAQALFRYVLLKRSGAGSGGSGTGRSRVKKDRANYRYFKCPGCRLAMRAPRGRGKVRVTCSKCAVQFYKDV